MAVGVGLLGGVVPPRLPGRGVAVGVSGRVAVAVGGAARERQERRLRDPRKFWARLKHGPLVGGCHERQEEDSPLLQSQPIGRVGFIELLDRTCMDN